MTLLALPQELLDEIAGHLDAFAYLSLRHTSNSLYHALGGDASLRTALVELETYWSREPHITAGTPRNTNQHSHHGKYSDVAMLPWGGLGGFDRMQFNTLGLTRQCIACTIQAAVASQPHANARSDPQVYLSMASTWTFWCTACETKITTEDPPFPRQHHAGLCLPCFDVANPGWLRFRDRLEVRVKPVQRYESWLRSILVKPDIDGCPAGATGNKARRVAGLQSPQDDVEEEEDWPLWRHVLADSGEMTREELHAKFANVARQMQSYLMWMRSVDRRKRVCRHKAARPAVNELSGLGEWPKWEDIIRELGESDGWGRAACGRRCKGEYPDPAPSE
ncbi:hypothetical protein B0A55_07681 [Friedmanniomyces simplex]|uniref:F-box domain-containing protein n=1 Tax=Friedmanniomyces simplex TaxID=329884 RepID=A0A4U0X975_9PEZI|nr:hypothetical protein B0A55_07681 [Friedmanniomyces simplex]